MSIKADIPQIAALLRQVETETKLQMKVGSEYLALVDIIERQLRQHVSETTLQRLWGYSTRENYSVSLRTLNVLSQLVGCDNWEQFCDRLRDESQRESDIFKGNALIVERLSVGTRLRIGWQPDRLCIARYIGNNRFVAELTENSTIQPGDSFSCLMMQKGRELYMDMFQRANDNGQPDTEARYVVGQRNGLTTLEILKND